MSPKPPRARTLVVAVMAVASIGAVAAACGGAGASTPTTSTAAATNADPGGRMGGFRNGTPPSRVQTSIAEGTPFSGFGNRTPNPDVQTAVAEGTVPTGRGGFGGGRALGTVAMVLGIDQMQLRSELQAAGATITSVAANHGIDRPTLRQKLIDANQQRLNDAVTNGSMTQDQANQTEQQFESNLDMLLDSNGGGPGGPPSSP